MQGPSERTARTECRALPRGALRWRRQVGRAVLCPPRTACVERCVVPPCDRARLQLDGVALHLVVEGGALDAEKFGRLFLVTAAFCERLKNGGSLEVVESLYAAAR